MPELRKDYVTDTWVVFSTVRSKRPDDLKVPSRVTPKEKCPFCPGHEAMTPPEILAYRKGGPPNSPGWWIRCIPNKYPALQVEGEVHRQVRQLFHSVNGVGAHEVIVESPEHDANLADLSDFQVQEVIIAYKQRYLDLIKDRRFKYILIFKNHGEKAGASQSHPHSQLISTPIVPRRIMEEVNAATHYYDSTGGSCIWCEVIETELEEEKRVVSENDTFVAISPFAARFPFETWILPKAHEMAFEDVTDEERTPFARMLKDVLGRLHSILDDPPFNYYIHTAPCDRKETRYHWHLEITPRLTETAGFERGTGFYINPVMPEDAAQILREGGKAEVRR
ncbi:MAG: galactose-1-phosphate uridylyltransferase [Euryarchaeota archaeon RBG_16_68_12]|nr:MAG: galactose-1-phosphate uridylyltransferase [Euryarchaeota archaeon RBG_16_68_12]